MKIFESSAKVFLTFFVFLNAVISIAAQGGTQHYNSPLYSPRSYEESRQTVKNDGLPPILGEVGIDQKLNEQIPLDAVFRDENGQEVKLGKFFNNGKPVVLALVYYECPMLCNEVLNGLVRGLKGMNGDAGKDFDVVAISFNPKETSELAKSKKQGYVERYGRAGTENGWHFLVGDQSSIDAVTKAVGFKYAYDEATKQYVHIGGIQILTPEGKLSRYLYGVEYAPKDIKFGLIESAENKIGTPVEQLLLYCYHYDPATGTYGFVVMRIVRFAGVLTLLTLFGVLFWLSRRKSKNAELLK